MFYVIWRA